MSISGAGRNPSLSGSGARTTDLAEMVRLATIPAGQLLAETRAALLLVDVQNRFIFGPSVWLRGLIRPPCPEPDPGNPALGG